MMSGGKSVVKRTAAAARKKLAEAVRGGSRVELLTKPEFSEVSQSFPDFLQLCYQC